MNFVSKLWRGKLPPAETVASKIIAVEAEREAASGRLSAAAAVLAAPATLSDEEHAAAEAASAAARRAMVRADAQIVDLRAALAAQVDRDAAEARAAKVNTFYVRRAALQERFESEFRDAARVMASVLTEAAIFNLDLGESGLGGEVRALTTVNEGYPLHEAVGAASDMLGDALSVRPVIPTSEVGLAREQRRRERAIEEGRVSAKFAAQRAAMEAEFKAAREEAEALDARSIFFPRPLDATL